MPSGGRGDKMPNQALQLDEVEYGHGVQGYAQNIKLSKTPRQLR
jgi:hypothetical protein